MKSVAGESVQQQNKEKLRWQKNYKNCLDVILCLFIVLCKGAVAVSLDKFFEVGDIHRFGVVEALYKVAADFF